MFCYNCGKEIDGKSVVCSGCGITLDKSKLPKAAKSDNLSAAINYKLLDLINLCVASAVAFATLVKMIAQTTLGSGSYLYVKILGGGSGFGYVQGIQSTAIFASAIFIISALLAVFSVKNSGLKTVHKTHFIVLGASLLLFYALCWIFGY
jgi:hypothetical protein